LFLLNEIDPIRGFIVLFTCLLLLICISFKLSEIIFKVDSRDMTDEEILRMEFDEYKRDVECRIKNKKRRWIEIHDR
jgi:hypothetical protein